MMSLDTKPKGCRAVAAGADPSGMLGSRPSGCCGGAARAGLTPKPDPLGCLGADPVGCWGTDPGGQHGADRGGADPGDADPGGADPSGRWDADPGDADPGGAGPGGADPSGCRSPGRPIPAGSRGSRLDPGDPARTKAPRAARGRGAARPAPGGRDRQGPGRDREHREGPGRSRERARKEPGGHREGTGKDREHREGAGSAPWIMSRIESLSRHRSDRAKGKDKERMKEGKEKDARYTNGHLFTTISVSGMTMCFACNKSITAKEALVCPTCNVTIHNRCKDTLPNCTKVKQKQQKAALLKNSSALQSVSLRNKNAIRERPNSAIYPSESFRQTLLGSRRGRPSLSLSKSVSTTNISGTFNDDSPLGIRRILSQSTDSLNMRNRTLSVESLIDEGPDVILSQLLSDLEADGKEFEADSWSLAVDNSFLQQHRMDVMKRQDVIYELMQTELHHVRTLKIMGALFRRAMLEELQLDPGTVQRIFPCLDELSHIHERFLAQLLERRRESLAQDSNKNFVIDRLGDILVSQFSGPSAEQLRKAYAEFCSKHTKALKEYKDLLARDKRFQQFIRRVTRSPLLRRHGVPECILLVTQRITKYPVLIERILKNSKDNEGDCADLSRALRLVKELLSAVDEEVHAWELRGRLWDVFRRVDPRAKVPLLWDSRPGAFGRDELLRRKLVHSGGMLWKTAAGRFKDVLVLLMTDVLVFLQEKDQKYTFPMLDKPAVISLQNLIVRDIANQEKGMFLISAAPPEMYEVHAASRDDRNHWMKVIQQAVSLCPSRQDFPLIETETEASLRKLKERMEQHDRQIAALLEEKVGIFADMLALGSGCSEPPPAPRGTPFPGDLTRGPRGDVLLHDAIREVECLKEIFTGCTRDRDRDQNQNNPPEAESCPSPSTSNGDSGSINGSLEFRADPDAGQRDGNGNQVPPRGSQEEINQRLVNLYGLLLRLQVQLTHQEVLLELQVPPEGLQRPRPRRGSQPAVPVTGGAEPGAGAELALLQRQHGLVQEELSRCRQLCQERAQEAAALESRLRDSERERSRLERELQEARGTPAGPRGRRAAEPRRRSLPAGDALYLSFTPPQVGAGHRGAPGGTGGHRGVGTGRGELRGRDGGGV
uniref:Rho guanine nucleotide exchange factor 2 n=1 Tax=Corvus moneduloides TaxID=1196302 RepID=A0A8C3D7F8_CORMO